MAENGRLSPRSPRINAPELSPRSPRINLPDDAKLSPLVSGTDDVSEHDPMRRKSRVSFMWDDDSPVRTMSPLSQDSKEHLTEDVDPRHLKVSFRYERGFSAHSQGDDSFFTSSPRINSGISLDPIDRLKSFRRGEFSTQSVQRGIPIGKGGNATVYLGMNTDTGQLIAVKEFKRSSLSEADLDLLLQEYELLASIEHPNLVKQFAFEFSNGKCSLYMQYIPGGSVSSVISQFKKLHEGIIRNYTQQLLLGLEFLHSKSIVHRDIKPSNMLADVDGTIKLADFGMARLLSSASSHTCNFQGSPPYMSPEACQGVVSFALDIWAVGCTVWEMATGQQPWQELRDLEPLAFLWRIGHEKRAPPVDHLTVSAGCRLFLAQCFVIDPEQRPACTTLLGHPFLQLETGSWMSTEFDDVVSPSGSRKCKAIMGWLKTKASNNQKAAEDEDWYTHTEPNTRSQNLLLVLRILHGSSPQQLTLGEREAIGAHRLLHRQTVDVKTLLQDYPPELSTTAELDHCRRCVTEGQRMEFSRWSEMPLPVFFTSVYTRLLVVARDDHGYKPLSKQDLIAGATPVYWYLLRCGSPQFADPDGSQEEARTQMLEHPSLGSIRQMLVDRGSSHTLTSSMGSEATPILVCGVPRVLEAEAERGHAPAIATDGTAVVDGHLLGAHPCAPGTTSNVAVFSFPQDLDSAIGRSGYTLEAIVSAMRSLYSVYMAIRIESLRMTQDPSKDPTSCNGTSPGIAQEIQIVVCMGHPLPGAGVRQDNLTMTVLLHLIAANMCGIDTLRFQTNSSHAMGLATEIFDQICGESAAPLVPLASLLVRLHDIASHWS